MTRVGKTLGRYKITKKATSVLFSYQSLKLEQDILGMKFKNPIGLSAGFDKNAELVNIVDDVGFGFTEVGSITALKCDGNPIPRLWRLPKSKSLVVHYGLKNDGSEAVAKRLSKIKSSIPMGVSVAMTNCEENVNIRNAIEDYIKTCSLVEPYGDYVTINISCPNAIGGQPFMLPHNLDYLLDSVDSQKSKKPIFVKLSPDTKLENLDAVLDVIKKHNVQGIICSNLTKKRNNSAIKDETLPEKGGLSGKAVSDLSDALIAHVYYREGNRFIIVGSGGVFTAKDAYKKIRLGASLVQMITGMVFEGPQVISEINQGLIELLKRDGYTNIKEVIGIDNKYHE
jgi:dihydroorotate dehydrogenase